MPDRNKAVKLHVEARAELQESIAFYRERAGEAWAARYKQRVAEGLKAIGANPERYPPAPYLPGVQKLRIEQFPFSLLYINRLRLGGCDCSRKPQAGLLERQDFIRKQKEPFEKRDANDQLMWLFMGWRVRS